MTEHADSSTSVVPPPDPELRRLEPLLGTWTTTDNTLDSVLGPGVPVTSTETFAWLDGGYFLVSTYETVFGDDPAQTGVNYWGYDTETGKFRIIFFSNNGPYTEGGNRYEGDVAGDRLTFEGPARFQYELDEHGRIKTNSDGTLFSGLVAARRNGRVAALDAQHLHQGGRGSVVPPQDVAATEQLPPPELLRECRVSFGLFQHEPEGFAAATSVNPATACPRA